MKKLIALLAVAAGIYSCDKIEGPTRENISVDTSCTFSEDNSPAVKKVLVEEYTGHNCGNCPEGGIMINDSMRTKYGDKLVVISVHAGDYANICPGMTTCPPGAPSGSFASDFKTAVGTEWNNFFGVSFYPAGMVDRMDYAAGEHLKPKSKWDQDTQERMNLPAKARIRIQNEFTDSSLSLRSCIEVKFMEAMSGDYKLSVVLTEDSVIDWQVWYGHNPELVSDYVHHHMLRTALNTAYGVPVGASGIEANSTEVTGYTINLDPSWNPDHCAVVAFLYNANTYEVLQVEEVKIR